MNISDARNTEVEFRFDDFLKRYEPLTVFDLLKCDTLFFYFLVRMNVCVCAKIINFTGLSIPKSYRLVR